MGLREGPRERGGGGGNVEEGGGGTAWEGEEGERQRILMERTE